MALPPAPSSKHSWSQSNENATAQRAPTGHSCGASDRPARTRAIVRRHSSSCIFHGWSRWLMARFGWLRTVAFSVQYCARMFAVRPVATVVSNNKRQIQVTDLETLQDKVILLTGASQGIGAATVQILARKGADLIAHHRGGPGDLDGAHAALDGVESGRKHFVEGDFDDETVADEVWAQALAWRDRIDVLVLNAAMMMPSGGVDDPDEEWDAAWQTHYRVNVLAPARLMRQAVRHFRSRGGGVIILMSSWVAQRGVTNPKMLAYAASKSAIKAVAQSIASGYAKDRIYAYIIAPGIVRTKMSVDFAKLQGGEDQVTRMLAMGEWVPPGEIGELIAFLASGKVRHLTGATLDVNGATYIR